MFSNTPASDAAAARFHAAILDAPKPPQGFGIVLAWKDGASAPDVLIDAAEGASGHRCMEAQHAALQGTELLDAAAAWGAHVPILWNHRACGITVELLPESIRSWSGHASFLTIRHDAVHLAMPRVSNPQHNVYKASITPRFIAPIKGRASAAVGRLLHVLTVAQGSLSTWMATNPQDKKYTFLAGDRAGDAYLIYRLHAAPSKVLGKGDASDPNLQKTLLMRCFPIDPTTFPSRIPGPF